MRVHSRQHRLPMPARQTEVSSDSAANELAWRCLTQLSDEKGVSILIFVSEVVSEVKMI
jgi:hypothetical protein